MAACNLVRAQLVRGIWGFVFLAAAALTFGIYPWISVGLVLAAGIPLRGCPLCWTVGLYEAWNKQKLQANDKKAS